MLRIGILQLGYETNTFSRGTASLGDMGTGDWFPADAVLQTFSGSRSAVGGAIDAVRAAGETPVPLDMITRGGAFNAGPTLAAGCLEEAMDHICAQLAQTTLDGLFYAMHGATCQENITDGDAYCLRRLRGVLPDTPIMCSMDLHGNITQEMCDLCDGIFGIKELPHLDFYEAGFLAASTLIRTLQGQCRPRMALVKLPMLLNSAAGNTISGTGCAVKEHFSDYVRTQGLLDATFFHGFSAMDAPITGCSVVAVADGFPPDAQAAELAQWVWQRRDEFVMPVYDGASAVDAALERIRDRYAVINDGSDNPGGGNPGDGTHLLRELLRRDLPGSIMGPLFDPEAADQCWRHRPGDRFSLTFGGRTDPAYGEPITAQVELIQLWDGNFRCVTPMYRGTEMCYGPSARLRCGNVEFILVSRRFQTYDDAPFTASGADMSRYKLVCLKSMNHFRAYFKDTADAIIVADTPSAYPADLKALPFQHIPRPIYPLDSL